MEYINTCPVCEQHEFLPFLETRDFFLSGEVFQIVSCKKCGFLLTQPRPEMDKLPGYYQSEDYISHSQTSKGAFTRVYKAVRQHTLKKKIRMIEKMHRPGHLLDIGCGTGEFLQLSNQKGWTCLGIEPGDSAREFAIRQYDLRVMKEEELQNIKDASMDVVTLWHVLEHVPDLNNRMQTLSRILKDDGLLVIAVPNADSFDASHYGNCWAAYDVPRHLQHFTPESLRQLIKKHGFQVTRQAPMRFDAYYICLLSEKYRTGKHKYFHAIYNGFRSNLLACRYKNYSSFILFCKKEKIQF